MRGFNRLLAMLPTALIGGMHEMNRALAGDRVEELKRDVELLSAMRPTGPRVKVDYAVLGKVMQTRRGQGTYRDCERYLERRNACNIGQLIDKRVIKLAARDTARSKYVPHVPTVNALLPVWGEAPNRETPHIARAVLKRGARHNRNLYAVDRGGMLAA